MKKEKTRKVRMHREKFRIEACSPLGCDGDHEEWIYYENVKNDYFVWKA